MYSKWFCRIVNEVEKSGKLTYSMYIGRYYHQIEEKGRVSLPKKFREQGTENFVITRGLDGGLFIYPEHAWQATIQTLSEKTETKKMHRDFVRLMTNEAQEVQVDKLGRIHIPEYLRNFAHLQKDVVVIGSFSKIEIWDVNVYHSYIENLEKNAENISELIE